MTARQWYDEHPVYFPADDEMLFGMLTWPARPVTTTVVVLTPGGWTGTSTARNRPLVNIARALASVGIPAFDFDYRGVGESTGEVRFSIEEPLVGDLLAAVRWLESEVSASLALCGVCYGSRVVLAAVPKVAGLAGVSLVSMPPGDGGKRRHATVQHAAETSFGSLIRRGLDPRAVRGLLLPEFRQAYARAALAKFRAVARRPTRDRGHQPHELENWERSPSAAVIGSIEHLVRRRIPVQFVYSATAPHFAEFQAGRSGRLGRILDAGGERIEIRAVGEDVEAFTKVGAQLALSAAVTAWISSLPATTGRDG